MRCFFFIGFFVFSTCIVSAQADTTSGMGLADDAAVFLDGVNVNKTEIENYDPMEIAFLTIMKSADSNQVARGLKDAIYVYTKKYARQQYWNYFNSKSPRYSEVVPFPGLENDIVYILNGIVLEENIESILYDINDSNFISLQVIDEKELKKQFKIKDKKWGVVVKAR